MKHSILSLFRTGLDSPSEFDAHVVCDVAKDTDQLEGLLRMCAPRALILKSSQAFLLSDLSSDTLPSVILIVEESTVLINPEIAARPEVTMLHCAAATDLWRSVQVEIERSLRPRPSLISLTPAPKQGTFLVSFAISHMQ